MKWNKKKKKENCTVSILQYVTDSNGNRVLNTAPVSNNLPIVSVYSSEVNTFRVTAQDPEVCKNKIKSQKYKTIEYHTRR